MKRLELLTPDQVREHWGEIRPDVARACRYSPDGDLPEDAFMAIMAGNAGCYATQDEAGVVTGGIIARKLQVSGRAVLVVWLGWNGNGETIIAEFWEQVVEIARELGCARVAIESTRPYHRAIPGVKLVSHTFHYEVVDGG